MLLEDYEIQYYGKRMVLRNRYSKIVRLVTEMEQENIESAGRAFCFASACLDNYLDAFFPYEVMV